MTPHFHPLSVVAVEPETANALCVTLAVPEAQREAFAFQPGQFLTLRAMLDGVEQRRSYSICSGAQAYRDSGMLQVGIKRVDGGAFSTWATTQLAAGATLDVMPPDGRFTPRMGQTAGHGPLHRVGFAAGSGITPMLSIIESTLHADADSRFTLVYGNQRVNTIMFNERLQDLKDKYPARLSLVHLLSRQLQEIDLLNGRIDAAKVAELMKTLIAPARVDEAFICGPEQMIEATEQALLAGGVAKDRIHTERFFSGATAPVNTAPAARKTSGAPEGDFSLDIILDGKTHAMHMSARDKVLDVALAGGLDLPYSCKGGVCCTCRARVIEGKVAMDRNYTLEQWEMDRGFVLTCQARPLTAKVVVSYDER